MAKRRESPGRQDDLYMDGKSACLQKALLELLKDKAPEIFTEGKVDPDKLKQTLGEDVATSRERYGLNWAGKSDCFRHIQEPTTATLKPCREESVDFDTTENLFIEGDNLQVLKVLQKSYYGKVKMIYIDPPYNTGNDTFIYPDRFQETQDEYLQRIGDKDVEGNMTTDGFWRKNSKDAGHFHSNWLSMMYPRLFLAKNLLQPDGVIFVSIDDNEVHNLRVMMNEIFGEENFLACIAWEKRYTRSNNAKMFYSLKDSILVYRRSEAIDFLREKRTEKSDSIYKNPDNDPRGSWTSSSYVNPATKTERPNLVYPIKNPFTSQMVEHPTHAWKYEQKENERHIRENLLWWGLKGEAKYPRLKNFLSDAEQSGLVPIDIWYYKTTGTTDDGGAELKSLFEGNGIFDNPKPYKLVSRMVDLVSTGKDEPIILDFFAGSGTTAHAVMQMNAEDGGNRKFICVQLPEACDKDSEAYNARFATIAEISKERIRRAANKIKQEQEGTLDFDGSELDLGFKVFKLDQSNFKVWRSDVQDGKQLEKQLSLFVDNVHPDAQQENILYELILKSGLDLNVKVESKKANSKQYFIIEDGKLILCLEEKITEKLIEKILVEKPQKVICLDRAFAGNDQLKTNSALQMEAEKIEFKVI